MRGDVGQVRNSKGEFLITKRHPDKKAGNLWEFTGGGTLAGESTKQSAVRELQEETGIQAKESELQLFVTYQHKNYFQNLFLLCKDIEISKVVLQPGETIDAKWATEETILQMIENGEFAGSFTAWRKVTVNQIRHGCTYINKMLHA